MVSQRLNVSVVLPTYNGETFISQQLESYNQQSRLPDELIITDDGSTDNTERVITEFARNSSFPVKFIKNSRRLGAFGNFAESIKQSSGKIICLSDQDDIWLPEHIEVLSSEFEQSSRVFAVCSNSVRVDETGVSTEVNTWRDVSRLGRKQFSRKASDAIGLIAGYRGIGNAHGLAISSNLKSLLVPNLKRFYSGASLDLLLLYGACLLGEVCFCYRPLTLYRRHASNLSSFSKVPNSQLLRNVNRIDDILLARTMQMFQALQLVKLSETGSLDCGKLKRYLEVLKHYSTVLKLRKKGLLAIGGFWNLILNSSYSQNSKGFRDLVADILAIARQPMPSVLQNNAAELVKAIDGELSILEIEEF